jgi:enoyl-CoA hydratase/carnithine racemase
MEHPDIKFEIQDDVAIVRLARPAKRNALSDPLIMALRDIFQNLPKTVRAALLDGEGPHFCAGLDLAELQERDAGQGLLHSRSWHEALGRIQFGPVPVIAVLHGAVLGGGLELASACHIRVADRSTIYGLPESSLGLFVGGGGSVRVPKLVGAARTLDMMLTARVYDAQEGERAGFAQYLVDEGQAFEKALTIAHRIAQNAPLANYALINALPRIAEQNTDHGLLMESLMSGIVQSAPEAKAKTRAFLEGRAGKVKKS